MRICVLSGRQSAGYPDPASAVPNVFCVLFCVHILSHAAFPAASSACTNMGDRKRHLEEAAEALRADEKCRLLKLSDLIETPPSLPTLCPPLIRSPAAVPHTSAARFCAAPDAPHKARSVAAVPAYGFYEKVDTQEEALCAYAFFLADNTKM